jgi:hypothetical protein
MGSDLNTWEGGRREPAYLTIRKGFADADETQDPTFRAGLTLDYLFFRIPSYWRGSARAFRDRFGSDHRPLIGRVEFGMDEQRTRKVQRSVSQSG